ncbi:MAG: hypothetical protein KH250_06625 [Bifidobacterium longum]|nr:hypothetical protein [Bifidobacterium longum]
MRRIPVDQGALGDMRYIQSETRTTPDGAIVMRDGLPVQRVSVLVKPKGDKPEVLEINVPSATPIVLDDNAKVRIDDLTAMPWSTDGRSGISWSAAGINQIGGVPKP